MWRHRDSGSDTTPRRTARSGVSCRFRERFGDCGALSRATPVQTERYEPDPGTGRALERSTTPEPTRARASRPPPCRCHSCRSALWVARPPRRAARSAPRVQHIAHGQVSEFTFDFAIFQSGDLKVFLDASRQTDGFAVQGTYP